MQGGALGWGAGVGWKTLPKPANVADAYAVGVVAQAVGTGYFHGAAEVDGAIAVDDVMVADALPALGAVPTVDVGHGVVATLWGGATVDDDLGDLSHGRSCGVKG